MKRQYLKAILQSLVIGYFLTALSLLTLAFLLYRFDLTETPIRVSMIVTYGAASFIGGWYAGRKLKNREFLWGMVAGLSYYLIHAVLSTVLAGVMPQGIVPVLSMTLICGGSGMLGGMLCRPETSRAEKQKKSL